MTIEKHWYRSSYTLLTLLLLPFSWLFRLLIFLRFSLYRAGWKKIISFPVPVIVVGNITVGGTGKTPMVIWLIHCLQKMGYQPGVVSRGVGGEDTNSLRWVKENSVPSDVGDEAVLIVKRTQCPMVICKDRVLAVRELLTQSTCNIVIADDGLQHYRLGRQIEIVMLDGARQVGNGELLPAGPLREPLSRLQRSDFILVQGSTELKLSSENVFTMTLVGQALLSFSALHETKSLHDLSGQTVHAVAAIGNPDRFFALLRGFNIQVIEHRFKDHYLFQPQDFAFADHLPIVMTEKDAVKCVAFANDFASQGMWYLPVDAELPIEFEKKLQEKIRCGN